MTGRPSVLAFGGGVQSSALLALLGQGRYPGAAPREVWFCDPKNERPQTYEWIARVIRPYCATLGVPFLTLEKQSRITGESLMESYRRRQQYPLRTNRQCTIDWKIKVMEAECKRRRWHEQDGVEKHIGISLDELHRARTGQQEDWETTRYPLIEARLFRDDCVRLCRQTWDEVPVKSGCWHCKYQRPAQWREVWDDRADGRWDQAVAWEAEVMAKHGTAGAFVDARIDRRTLTLLEWAARWALGEQIPLPVAETDQDQDGACDGGYCMV